jgi:hypothetical protein
MKFLKLAGLALLTTGLGMTGIAVAPGALAQGLTVDDRVADVVHFSYGDETRGEFGVDVTRVRVNNDTNNSGRIAVTTNFSYLGSYDWFEVRIDTDNDGRPDFRILDKNSGDRTLGVFTNRYDRTCNGAQIVNRIHDFIKVSAPRGCFDNPGAIRAKIVVERSSGCYDGKCYHLWDDATALTKLVHRG